MALAGNLSALGVSASQLDNCLCTFTRACFTGCRPPASTGRVTAIGDYEYHEKVATLLGVHFTYSREDAQEQPGSTLSKNSQIRLSDGTLLFAPKCFQHRWPGQQGGTFQMLDLDAGVKVEGLVA